MPPFCINRSPYCVGLPSTLYSTETRKNQPLKALPIPARSKVTELGDTKLGIGHKKVSQKERDLNPVSTSTVCTTSWHNIRAAPPSGSIVKRASSLKSTFQEALAYHCKYETRKANNLY